MAYVRQMLGNYGGLADSSFLPSVTIPKNPSGSYIIVSSGDPYWGYPIGRPYIGMRPPPPFFGKNNPPFITMETPLQEKGPGEISPLPLKKKPSPALYELWDARRR